MPERLRLHINKNEKDDTMRPYHVLRSLGDPTLLRSGDARGLCCFTFLNQPVLLIIAIFQRKRVLMQRLRFNALQRLPLAISSWRCLSNRRGRSSSGSRTGRSVKIVVIIDCGRPILKRHSPRTTSSRRLEEVWIRLRSPWGSWQAVRYTHLRYVRNSRSLKVLSFRLRCVKSSERTFGSAS
jgi:hypothetical protein